MHCPNVLLLLDFLSVSSESLFRYIIATLRAKRARNNSLFIIYCSFSYLWQQSIRRLRIPWTSYFRHIKLESSSFQSWSFFFHVTNSTLLRTYEEIIFMVVNSVYFFICLLWALVLCKPLEAFLFHMFFNCSKLCSLPNCCWMFVL